MIKAIIPESCVYVYNGGKIAYGAVTDPKGTICGMLVKRISDDEDASTYGERIGLIGVIFGAAITGYNGAYLLVGGVTLGANSLPIGVMILIVSGVQWIYASQYKNLGDAKEITTEMREAQDEIEAVTEGVRVATDRLREQNKNAVAAVEDMTGGLGTVAAKAEETGKRVDKLTAAIEENTEMQRELLDVVGGKLPEPMSVDAASNRDRLLAEQARLIKARSDAEDEVSWNALGEELSAVVQELAALV